MSLDPPPPATTPHEHFLRLALDEGRKNPTAPFGTVIVDVGSGEVVARGFNRADANPVLHGEMDALLQLPPADEGSSGRDESEDDEGERSLALYTTAEPCPMCAAASVLSGIDHLVWGVSIPELVMLGFPQIDLRCRDVVERGPRTVTTTGGVLHEDCFELFDLARRLRDAERDS